MRPAAGALLAALGLVAAGALLVPEFGLRAHPTLTLVEPEPGAKLMLREVAVSAEVQGQVAGGRYLLSVDGRAVRFGRLHGRNRTVLVPGLSTGHHTLAIVVYGLGYRWHYTWPVDVLPGALVAPPRPSGQTGRALDDVNSYRAAADLQPMRLSRALEAAAQAHGDFFSRNVDRYGADLTVSVHDERPTWPGFVGKDPFTRDLAMGYNGDGDSEVMAFGVNVDDAVWLWMDSVYHRIGLIDPGLTTMGFGMAGQGSQNSDLPVTVIDSGFTAAAESPDSVSIIWPPPGLAGVSRAFYQGEIPDPLSNFRGARYPAGYPITLSFFGLNVSGLRLGSAALTDGGHKVPAWVLTPQNERDPAELGYTIAIIPRSPLRANAMYSARMTGWFRTGQGWHPFSRTWQFSTANVPDPSTMRSAGTIAVQTPEGRSMVLGRAFAGTVYVPLRAITGSFGAGVQWSARSPDRTSVTMLGHRVTFTAQNFLAEVDGRTVKLSRMAASPGPDGLVPAIEFAHLLGLHARLAQGTLQLGT